MKPISLKEFDAIPSNTSDMTEEHLKWYKSIRAAVEQREKLLKALIRCHDYILAMQTSAHEGENIRLEARAAIALSEGGEA